MARIRFTCQGSNSAIGGFSQGDVFTCSEALAEHLVNQARVAEYMQPIAPPPSQPSTKPAAKRSAKKG
jgi:hypothetical protein